MNGPTPIKTLADQDLGPLVAAENLARFAKSSCSWCHGTGVVHRYENGSRVDAPCAEALRRFLASNAWRVGFGSGDGQLHWLSKMDGPVLP